MGLHINNWDTPHIGMNPHHHRRSFFSPLQGFRGDSRRRRKTAENGMEGFFVLNRFAISLRKLCLRRTGTSKG
jgi:hypothetical protein